MEHPGHGCGGDPREMLRQTVCPLHPQPGLWLTWGCGRKMSPLGAALLGKPRGTHRPGRGTERNAERVAPISGLR